MCDLSRSSCSQAEQNSSLSSQHFQSQSAIRSLSRLVTPLPAEFFGSAEFEDSVIWLMSEIRRSRGTAEKISIIEAFWNNVLVLSSIFNDIYCSSVHLIRVLVSDLIKYNGAFAFQFFKMVGSGSHQPASTSRVLSSLIDSIPTLESPAVRNHIGNI